MNSQTVLFKFPKSVGTINREMNIIDGYKTSGIKFSSFPFMLEKLESRCHFLHYNLRSKWNVIHRWHFTTMIGIVTEQCDFCAKWVSPFCVVKTGRSGVGRVELDKINHFIVKMIMFLALLLLWAEIYNQIELVKILLSSLFDPSLYLDSISVSVKCHVTNSQSSPF